MKCSEARVTAGFCVFMSGSTCKLAEITHEDVLPSRYDSDVPNTDWIISASSHRFGQKRTIEHAALRLKFSCVQPDIGPKMRPCEGHHQPARLIDGPGRLRQGMRRVRHRHRSAHDDKEFPEVRILHAHFLTTKWVDDLGANP